MGGHVLAHLLRDARFSVRLLGRTPAHTLVAIITLALGISATTAIFSVVYGTFFAPLPYIQSDRLVMLWEQDRGQRRQVSPRNYLAWKRLTGAFADVNAWSGRSVNVATDDRPENVNASIATPGFLPMLGYGHPLALGRTFSAEEGLPGHDNVVILTWQLWQDRFGGDPRIVGRQIRLDDKPYTVIGVLGKGAADRTQSKVWLPLAFTDADLQADNQNLNVMGRLADGVSIGEANARVAALSAAIERDRSQKREGWTVSVEAFRNNFVRDTTKRGIWLLLGAVLFLLLIACANVANLLLARGSTRQRELAIRAAIGATSATIASQLLVESLVLALTGGALGALLTLPVLNAIVALMPAFTLPSETEITLSLPVLLFAVVMCVISGVAAGLAPAWQSARTNPVDAMKEGGRAIGDRRSTLRRGIVVVEFALALTLLAGGGIAIKALARIMSVEPGFRDDHLLTFRLPIARGRLDTPDKMRAFYASLSEQLETLPGVVSASISTGMPVTGFAFGRPFQLAEQPSGGARRPFTGLNVVTPSYHATFGIPILRGRAFTDADRAGTPPVAIVNEAFATRFLPGREAIGQRVLIPAFASAAATDLSSVAWEIVGVQGNAINAGAGRAVEPELLVPFAQNPWPRILVAIRTDGDGSNLQTAVARVLRSLDPGLPMADVRTIEQTINLSFAADRFYTVFIAAFAAVALVLAAIGIYGVMSFAVVQRQHEIGIRMALGGRPRQVLMQVLREGMTTALGGTALGAAGAMLIGRLLAGTVYGVEPASASTFVVVASTLVVAALLACFVPARRAASVDPMTALRQP